MNEQSKNELLCEKLLGWRPMGRDTEDGPCYWQHASGPGHGVTPTFLTGDGMLLLLEALERDKFRPFFQLTRPSVRIEQPWFMKIHRTEAWGDTAPAAVRAAALAYVRASEQAGERP